VPLSTFLDAADQRGIAYDAARAFEEQLDDKLGSGHVKVDVVMIPVARDELISGLIEGYGDIAFGNITITPERAALVDFSDPFLEGVKEIVVTGPDSSALANLDDLGGREAYVRESSSYDQSLTRLNEWLRADGKAQVTLTLAPEVLEDEDTEEEGDPGRYGLRVAATSESFAPSRDSAPSSCEVGVDGGGRCTAHDHVATLGRASSTFQANGLD
jgi:membrane-bound lytic murein transglycosylase MltF